jgi:hypothetical protein
MTVKSKTEKDSQIKFYKVMTYSVLLYGSENLALSRSEGRKIETAEMRFLRRNTTIHNVFVVYALEERIQDYKTSGIITS